LMTFTSGGGQVTATAVLGGDCGTDCPRNGAFYDRRSRFLCRCRSGVEQPSAVGSLSVTSSAPLPVFWKHLKPRIVEIEHANLRRIWTPFGLLESADLGGRRRQPEERVTSRLLK